MATGPITPNPYRYDPYKNFKFRLIISGRAVAGISSIRNIDNIAGSLPTSASDTGPLKPGLWKFEPLTLERGVTHDSNFQQWASQTIKVSAGIAGAAKQDIDLQMLDEKGEVAKQYRLHNCWVSEYQALPELDAAANAVAIQHMLLHYENCTAEK